MASKKTSDALAIIDRRFFSTPEAKAELDEARESAAVARRVYELRTKAGLTQKELAKLIGTTHTAISRLENDDYQGHSLAMLRRIAAALGRRVEVRFVPEDPPAPDPEPGAENPVPMHAFHHRIEVAATREGPFVPVDALVDTGATYTLLPGRLTEELGVGPREQDEFVLPDGRTVMRDIAEVFVRVDGKVRSTLCIIGKDTDDALLGAYTLEGFGLAADPFNKRLVAAPKYLLQPRLRPPAAARHGRRSRGRRPSSSRR